MSEWPMRPLGELSAPKRGSVNPADFPDESFDLYSIPAYDQGVPERRTGAEIGSNKQVVAPGDVLLSRIAPHIRRAWVVPEPNSRRAIASSEWIVYRHGIVRPEYLRYFLLSDSFHAQFMRTLTGVGGSLMRASKSAVAKILVPIPSLEEQERIVKLLDEADALRRLRAEADRRTAELIPALFYEMFGDPVRNEKGWPHSKLEEQLKFLEYGPRFYDERYSAEGTRIARITDLDEFGNLNFETMPRLQIDPKTVQTRGLSSGDLVFARSGATVGKIAIIPEDAPECIAGAYFIRLRFASSVDPFFALHHLRFPGIQLMIEAGSRQSAQQNFSGPGIKRLPFIVPPQNLQAEFRARSLRASRLAFDQRAAKLNLERQTLALSESSILG